MRAFLTGARGFLGRRLAAHLATCGDKAAASGVDILDTEGLRAELARARPDVVFHLAGVAATQRAHEEPERTYRVNVLGTTTLLEAARQAAPGARVLAFTSGQVYGDVPAARQPIREEEPVNPVTPYGASKAACSHVAEAFRRAHGMDVVDVRPFPTIGPGQRQGFAVSDFARRIARIEAGLTPPRMEVGNLESIRDFVDVRDAVRAYRLIALMGAPAPAYNVCRGVPVRVADLLDRLVALADRRIEIAPVPRLRRPVDVPRLVGSPQRVRHDTGWEPARPLEESLGAALDSWRERVAAEGRGSE